MPSAANSSTHSTKKPSLSAALVKIQQGLSHDPFEILGCHVLENGQKRITTFLPTAESVKLKGVGAMQRIENSDCFIIDTSKEIEKHYSLQWVEKGNATKHETTSAYSFGAQIGDLDLHLFKEGKHHHAWHFLGAQITNIDGVSGCKFAVWVPGVLRVSIVGDFNAWDSRRHPMRCRGDSGVWELFIPGIQAADAYKYNILPQQGSAFDKADPYGRSMSLRPETTSLVPQISQHQWQDHDWLEQRKHFDWQHSPISIYECHVGSWRRNSDGSSMNWRQLVDNLIPWVIELGYTHIELLPISEYPLDESWGYQVSGYFSPTARYGSSDDLRFFVDACHQQQLGVILDWVPAHFPKDGFALARFTGEATYEHVDPKRAEHKDWGTLVFDYGRKEVHNFLLANAVYWMEEFHMDGLRVDAVASMLYLEYSRKAGEWSPNIYGGRENLEAIDFLREMNRTVHDLFPGVLTIAEESTTWPMVSRPLELGGLGFSMKWNMGWMNDNLSYIQTEPVHRKYHQNLLTFSQLYAWTENFVLPLSHDEVVHGKRSMLSKMPGDNWQMMANLRLFYAWQYAHPGKKLLFMGDELGQWTEWNELIEIDWPLLDFNSHAGVKKLLSDLNQLYRQQPAMHQLDFDPAGFQWIDCHDSEQSTLSLIRRAQNPEDHIICLLNFTPVPREDYRIGVPASGGYREILNTDSSYYDGTNLGNLGTLTTDSQNWMGFEQSISLTLPPLAAIFLIPDNKSA